MQAKLIKLTLTVTYDIIALWLVVSAIGWCFGM